MGAAGWVARARRIRPTHIFIALTCVVAVLGILTSVLRVGGPSDVQALVVLCALGALSQIVNATDVGQRVTLSFLSIIGLASIPMTGPVGAAVVGLVAQVFVFVRTPLAVRLFNAAMNAVLGVVGGLVYVIAGGTLQMSGLESVATIVRHLALPLLAADVAQMLCNAALLAGILRVDRGTPWRLSFAQMVGTSGGAYFGYGAISFLFVVLWVPGDVGPFSAVLILAPLFVARWIIVQYGDEVRSHESALSALITATEIKDPASRGHSARVAQLAAWMVEPLGLGSAEASDLRLAAMLHDVGKISLSTSTVRHGGQDVARTLTEVTSHTGAGVALLADMDFVRNTLPAVRHHHERWDGQGYPDGLTGELIPLHSRIIAVADAYDALTTARPGRPALDKQGALDIVSSRAGTQFDPSVVAALGKALERREWPGTHPSDDELLMTRDYLDHDHPEVSDLHAKLTRDRSRGFGAGVRP